ncbi:hypothetical protein IE53DRAFT_362806 [Violaceomyces palustris]|uniref:Uncharacterized protein n=1 Tax=Violaceomyces palustris TaxID=1673888 RepID=A0ACD0NVY1_9BASI|nr:hypothetical protein IE53DRAFT_362806 [Violaceomyces palustris]
MSVLSALMGVMFPSLLPKELTTFMAAVLFFVFGAKMMREGLAMTGDEMEEEWEEAEREIREEEDGHEMDTLEQGQANGSSNAHSATNGGYPSVTPYPSTTIGKEGPSEEVQGSEATTQKGPPRSYTGGLKDGAKNLCGLCFSPGSGVTGARLQPSPLLLHM